MTKVLVTCKSCTRHYEKLVNCGVWLAYLYDPETTVVDGEKLLKELGNKPPFDPVALRECQHFSGQYPFTIGD